MSSPVWNAAGTSIAFVAADGDKHTIRVLARDGGESRIVIAHPNPPMALAWSPDGNRIAYTLKVDPENPAGEVRPAGSPPPVRATTRLDYKQDNRGYLNDTRHQLYVVNVETGAATQLSRPPRITISPNGDRWRTDRCQGVRCERHAQCRPGLPRAWWRAQRVRLGTWRNWRV